MSRKQSMSWEGAPGFRWKKMFKGTMYRVSCSDLGLPDHLFTKDGSLKAANEWWEKKLVEVSAQPPVTRAVEGVLASLPSAEARAETIRLAELYRRAEVAERWQNKRTQANILLDLEPSELDDQARVEKLGTVASQINNVPTERTVGALADLWIGQRAEQARQGLRSADGHNNTAICLGHFTKCVGGNLDIAAVDYDTWQRWFDHCRAMVVKRDKSDDDGWSVDYAKKCFSVSRTFMTWVHERAVLDVLPRNILSKQHRFERPAKEIITFTNEEIATLLENAIGQHRLHLLLMLNLGCTQKDISDLRKDEIDLKSGMVRRRRSKTKLSQNTPLVGYKLWPETLAEAKRYWSGDPEIAFLTERRKKQWVRKETLPNGKLKKSDSIATQYQKLMKTCKITKSLKIFRKTSSTRLKSNLTYRPLVSYFLGHGGTLADQVYAAESQELLDQAIDWLRTQYGIGLKAKAKAKKK